MPQKSPRTIYPLYALKAVILHAQRLTTPNHATPALTADAIVELAKTLGYIQIDTLHVVNRAHYVTLWSRFGSYDLNLLRDLLYVDGQRRLYEGWGHAASIIPLEHYRYHRWRTIPEYSYNPCFVDWSQKENNRQLAAETLKRIRAEGGLRVQDFDYDGPQMGEWYDWKPPKMALEALFARGELMVAKRVHFKRIYELRERVMPDWVDTTPIEPDEGRRFCLEQAARALGVFEPASLTLYAYMRSTPARSLIKDLTDEGVLVRINAETLQGVKTWMIHRDNLPLLQRAADGEIQSSRTTFLAPFDSLFWARGRDQKLWGFEYLLECYKPADQRVYGYFSFPILHKDRLAGRFDPKLERKTGEMVLNAIHLEPGIEPDDELVSDVAAALRGFLAWHEAKNLRVEQSNPAEFGEKLLRAL
ncbi:MAG: YcaQ family DNA glycosylase [Anaerolineaceae bacterium]|nr:YcaQ family DNA glycosylase [Anaerolineaceae bacterium]